MFDFGYDISDYLAVDPVFGTLERLRRADRAAHARGMKAAHGPRPLPHVDRAPVVPRAPRLLRLAADEPPTTGARPSAGRAWSRTAGGRWYLHSFYPEQADLDWRNPDVVAAMQEVVRFWLDRGVDGYRVDAIDRLLKDPELRDDPPAERPFGLPLPADNARWR